MCLHPPTTLSTRSVSLKTADSSFAQHGFPLSSAAQQELRPPKEGQALLETQEYNSLEGETPSSRMRTSRNTFEQERHVVSRRFCGAG